MLPRLLLALMLLAAACGDIGAPDAETLPPDDPPAAAAAPGTDPLAVTTSQGTDAPADAAAPGTGPPADTASPGAGLPAVPDFELQLENQAGTFVLSEAATPVYLTFWAEW